MSNLSNQTGNINIQHPERWTLQLALHPRVLRYLLFDRQVDNSLIAGEIPLDTSASTYLKAVENAIYDNSPLLDDYGNVRLLVDTMHFVLLPNEVADEAEADELLHLQFPELEGDTALCALPQCGVKLAFELPPEVLGFLQRTFNMAPIVHHLQPLCDYYARFCQHTLKKAGVVCHMVQVPAHAKGDAVCCVSPDKGLAFFQGLCQPFSVQSQVFCRLIFPFAVVVIRDVLHASSLDYVAVDCPNLNHLSLF